MSTATKKQSNRRPVIATFSRLASMIIPPRVSHMSIISLYGNTASHSLATRHAAAHAIAPLGIPMGSRRADQVPYLRFDRLLWLLDFSVTSVSSEAPS